MTDFRLALVKNGKYPIPNYLNVEGYIFDSDDAYNYRATDYEVSAFDDFMQKHEEDLYNNDDSGITRSTKEIHIYMNSNNYNKLLNAISYFTSTLNGKFRLTVYTYDKYTKKYSNVFFIND